MHMLLCLTNPNDGFNNMEEEKKIRKKNSIDLLLFSHFFNCTHCPQRIIIISLQARLVWHKPGICSDESSINTCWVLRWYFKLVGANSNHTLRVGISVRQDLYFFVISYFFQYLSHNAEIRSVSVCNLSMLPQEAPASMGFLSGANPGPSDV